MSAQKALMELKFSIYHVIATGLESISHLSAPIGPLARIMWQGEGPDDNHDHLTVFSTGSTSILVFTTTREHMGLDKCAHYFTQSPTLRTITVVQLALPMQLETDDRQVRRLTEHSHVSVFTKVNGPVRAVVQRESLSTPGGAIKFWVSDLVKQDDDAKCLPDEFTRPLHNEYVFFFPASEWTSYILTLCCSQGRQPSRQHHHPVFRHRLQAPPAVRTWYSDGQGHGWSRSHGWWKRFQGRQRRRRRQAILFDSCRRQQIS